MWKCPRCEVLNEDHLDECEVCFYSKSSTASVVEDTWICPRCETINVATQDVCEVCFAAKPGPECISSESKPRRRRASRDELVASDKDSNSVVDYNHEEEMASSSEITEEQLSAPEDVSQTHVANSKEMDKSFEESIPSSNAKPNEISMGKLACLVFFAIGIILLFAAILNPLSQAMHGMGIETLGTILVDVILGLVMLSIVIMSRFWIDVYKKK